MKNLFIILIVLMASCATSKTIGTKTFKLTKAEKQAYTLGKKMNNGKTSGITHSMFFEVKGDIKVEKVWINDVNLDFEVVKTNAEGDIRIRATFYNGTKSNIHTKVVAPIEYEGVALIQYKENGESKYVVLKEFKEYPKLKGAK